jgi:hypothetical protein
VPLKTTDEVDWVGPLKNYIRMTSGDPDKFSEVSPLAQYEDDRH